MNEISPNKKVLDLMMSIITNFIEKPNAMEDKISCRGNSHHCSTTEQHEIHSQDKGKCIDISDLEEEGPFLILPSHATV